jgi:hypothetical protein
MLQPRIKRTPGLQLKRRIELRLIGFKLLSVFGFFGHKSNSLLELSKASLCSALKSAGLAQINKAVLAGAI